MSDGVTRREALAKLGALAGAAAVGPRVLGCGGDGDGGPGAIKNIVVLMMENRSYDHYLGARALLEGKPGDGLRPGMSNPDLSGAARPVYRETVSCVADPPHSWVPSRVQWNQGANDGFVRAYQNSDGIDIPPHVMGWFGREELPILWSLADEFASCDRWFASIMAPTWPNRLYLYGGQSGGAQSNLFLPGESRFTFPLILDRLDEAGIDWRIYYSDVPFGAVFERVTAGNITRIDLGFFDDAAAGRLPPVTFIDPAFSRNDDHPPHHPTLGQQFIATVYAALAASPQWKDLLFVVVYDEHGGFFDHVSPPTAPDERAADGFDQLGFRVPALVAGPYVKRGHVSSVVRDHTSVLRHIEGMFGLAPLTMRDAAATDLSECLDADRLARGDPRPAPMLPPLVFDEETFDRYCYATGGGGIPKRTELELAFDAGLLPREWDARHAWRDQLRVHAEVLERLGAGGIRRR